MNVHEIVAMREILDAAQLAAMAGDTASALKYQVWAINPRKNFQKILLERFSTLKNKSLTTRLKNAINYLQK